MVTLEVSFYIKTKRKLVGTFQICALWRSRGLVIKRELTVLCIAPFHQFSPTPCVDNRWCEICPMAFIPTRMPSRGYGLCWHTHMLQNPTGLLGTLTTLQASSTQLFLVLQRNLSVNLLQYMVNSHENGSQGLGRAKIQK